MMVECVMGGSATTSTFRHPHSRGSPYTPSFEDMHLYRAKLIQGQVIIAMYRIASVVVYIAREHESREVMSSLATREDESGGADV